MIDVKQAVSSATQYLLNLMGAESVSDVLLEEVEPSDDERFWHITLSAALPAPKDGMNAIAAAFGNSPRRRVYKDLEVDAATGSVRSMKMRSVHE